MSPACWMSALGKEVALAAATLNSVADKFLAFRVALGCIDDVETQIEGGVKHFFDGDSGDSLVPDLRSPEAQDAHLHVGLAKLSPFHASFINDTRGDSQATGVSDELWSKGGGEK